MIFEGTSFTVEFGSLVQCSSRVRLKDDKFLCEAKIRRSYLRLVRCSVRRNAPFTVGIFFCVFHLPDGFGQFGGVSFMELFKALIMVEEASIKFRLATSIIISGGFFKYYCRLTRFGALATFSIEWAACFFLQLRGGAIRWDVAPLFNKILLCLEMIAAMLGVQLQLPLTLYLLQVLCRW